ncbi:MULTISPECIES: ABC transporter substrate-binding protein [unclassified Corynebacterium]|uniref:ABC transporter substrate-binding protein n=1 Tax=unclassified Corynebacterium TaxID=2624378 RepID=UPI001FEF18FC|nr:MULTISPECIES: ABC transporter substrate-binding protein [unclassified Corynebacterium]
MFSTQRPLSQLKRLIAVIVLATMMLCGLSACGTEDDKGSVYFLNFKPEADETFQAIAREYEKETGVPVKVATAASGEYELTLKIEMMKRHSPTLFNVNGPVGLHKWLPYTADISDAEFVRNLKDDNLALKGDDGKTYGVPLAVEGYGIIYNQEIFDRYCALPGAKVASAAQINNFATLKAVAEDMQARKDQLGIQGAFASTSLASGEDWRWQTHLTNIPIYYELNEQGISDTKDIKFTYNQEFKQIFDLYLNNSTIDKKLAPSKNVTDSLSEFAQGKAAMIQNGNWAWSQISGVKGNIIKEDNIKFLPIYTGHAGEETQGLAVGTEVSLAVNARATKADQRATIEFVNWLLSSDVGKRYVSEDLGFNAPFTTFGPDDIPSDPLTAEVAKYVSNEQLRTIPWIFTIYPSQKFKDTVGQSMAQYASGSAQWQDVVDVFVDEWKAEKEEQ